MQRFTLPRDIYFGEGALEAIKSLRGFRRAMVVTGGSSMQRFGFLDKLIGILRESELEVALFEGVEPDPSGQTVLRGATAMREFGPDLIVALGGGSPIDAAKAMWVFYEYPHLTFDRIKPPFVLPELRRKAKFIAIPSTCSSSEVSSYAVITNYDSRIKYPLSDFEITPDIAILDPALSRTMPKSLVADSGMDSLCHAIEAFVSIKSSVFSDPMALHAITVLSDDLPASFHGDLAARDRVHLAQCLSGMAFSNAQLGIANALSHKVAIQFHLSHGRCNAILLPYVICFNAKMCGPRYAAIARHLGLAGNTDTQLIHALVEHIQTLCSELGIAENFKASGVDANLFYEQINVIAQNAQDDPCTDTNPRDTSEEDLRQILLCAFEGRTVAF